jgi:prepilin-type N-terminal cleavage/methylation domain-containing protein
MRPCSPCSPSRCSGFTLVELLVVIAVIALLVGLAVVAIGGARRAALDSSDKARLRGLAQASQTYAASNKGRLPSPRTDTPGDWGGTPPAACGSTQRRLDADNPYVGWVCADNSRCPGATVGDTTETLAAIEGGSLFSYVDSADAYRSPMDNSGRLRSYSINAWVGVLYCDDYAPLLDVFRGGVYPDACSLAFDTRTLSRIPRPSDTAMFMPDWDPFKRRGGTAPGWNFNGMLLNPNPASRPSWFDLPAIWNPGQSTINYSTVDGGTASYRIQSTAVSSQQTTDRLLQSMGNNPYQGLPLFGADPSKADLVGLSRLALPGLLKTTLPTD